MISRFSLQRAVFLTLAILAVMVGSGLLPDAVAHALTPHHTTPFLLGLVAPVVGMGKTASQLRSLSSPERASLGESVPGQLFDTQTYVSTTTLNLTFFQTQQTDPTLGNLETAGSLTDPQFFEIWNIGIDFLTDGTLSGAADEKGALDDVAKLVMVGRGIWRLMLANKSYCGSGFPISFLHSSGGPAGYGYGAAGATVGVQFGQNGWPDGGFNWLGSVIIPPKIGFSVQMQWAAAQTLNFGNTPIRFHFTGVLHRRVQ